MSNCRNNRNNTEMGCVPMGGRMGQTIEHGAMNGYMPVHVTYDVHQAGAVRFPGQGAMGAAAQQTRNQGMGNTQRRGGCGCFRW
ncbi:hypothetical protein LJC20_04175 [Eubacteriales bacterium OttesenSCG-928-M02]|nr:hypothetical protein [Eubacteriales bacterium OttesenSCG-928-M02]